MPEEIAAGLVPPVHRRGHKPNRAKLPFPNILLPPIDPSWFYNVCKVDKSGRCADLAALKKMNWTPGQRLTFTAHKNEAILVTGDPDGAFELQRNGRLHLPAPLKARCWIGTGDRVLLAANPDENSLIVYTMASLELAITSKHSAVLGGKE